MSALDLIEEMSMFGLEKAIGRFYSQYQGIVIRTDDPLGLGRVMVRVPVVTGNDTAPFWAYPSAEMAGKGHGFFFPPYVGDPVTVSFELGDPKFPRYRGGWYGKVNDAVEVPEPAQPEPNKEPTKRGVYLKNGSMLHFDESEDGETVQLVWSSNDGTKKAVFGVDKFGSTSIVSSSGRRLVFDEENKQMFFADIDDAGDTTNNMSADVKNGWTFTAAKGGSVQTALVLGTDGTVSVQAQSDIILTAPNVSIDCLGASLGGVKAVHPIPKGDLLATLLTQLIAQIASMTFISSAPGSPTPPAVNSPAIAALAGQVATILSLGHKVGE